MSTLVRAFAAAMLLQLSLPAAAQQQLEGIVRDSDGTALPGATVAIPGTGNYTVTAPSGAFTLSSKQPVPYTLSVRLVGYKPVQVEVYEVTDPLEITLHSDGFLSEVTVTARRRSESERDIPIPITVVGGVRAEDAGAFNVNRLKEMVPSVQLYSSNPRNTTLNIRGLGSTFGLTNDGIDPGVGFYVDGVYYARPAATTLDFIDVERIEILRGPQGTLFGKNTTAGAFNITTRKPSFTPSGTFELSFGNLGFVQAKSSVTGPLNKIMAARFSFTGTQRDGTLYNVARDEYVNDMNNLGVRGQLLIAPKENIEITLAADASRQRPNGYAQVVAGVVTTQRPAYRQFNAIVEDLNYQLPSLDPFDRKIDHDTPWRSDQDLGGVSLNVEWQLGRGTLTSTSAWRYWNWNPSNDRDFTGLQALALSQAPSKHYQWSQEVRYSGTLNQRMNVVGGIYLLDQSLKTDPYHTEESGADQWRFSQSNTSDLWQTPGLLDGYGIRTFSTLDAFGAAAFGQLDWSIGEKFHLMPGVRLNYDRKQVDYDRQTYGGLDTDDPQLIAIKESVYSGQSFTTDVSKTTFSGQVTLSFKESSRLNAFATYATNYKPVGVNLGGLPTSGGQPMLALAEVKPEYVQHAEVGVKTVPVAGATADLTVFNTSIKDYQTLVLNSQLGVNRGYLANAESVRVTGVELEGSWRLEKRLDVRANITWVDGRYVEFKEAPSPLEDTGGEPFKDISGEVLPGISKWAGSLSAELSSNATHMLGLEGNLFFAADVYYRSSFSSSPTPSPYLMVDGYELVNARAGFRTTRGLSIFVWTRNAFSKNYFEQLLVAAGNAGHYAGVLGDPRTFGITSRYNF